MIPYDYDLLRGTGRGPSKLGGYPGKEVPFRFQRSIIEKREAAMAAYLASLPGLIPTSVMMAARRPNPAKI